MVRYKPERGYGFYHILGTMILYNIIIIIALIFVQSYVLVSLLKVSLFVFNIYELYYILLIGTLKYDVDDEFIYINSIVKRRKIAFGDIEGYKINRGNINGIKLSGFGTNYFAIGKSVIKKIGTTSMYVTSNKNIFYLKSGDLNYAVSPTEYLKFEELLKNNNINIIDWEHKFNKENNLHKDKSFMIPFIIVTLIVTVLTLNPFMLYLMNKLPLKMPLNFDSSFLPVEYGTGKQFAFNQMVYGVLNMAIQFCMYYASHFYAKYDRKSSNKFIYASLVIAAAFLIIQIRIIVTFR